MKIRIEYGRRDLLGFYFDSDTYSWTPNNNFYAISSHHNGSMVKFASGVTYIGQKFNNI